MTGEHVASRRQLTTFVPSFRVSESPPSLLQAPTTESAAGFWWRYSSMNTSCLIVSHWTLALTLGIGVSCIYSKLKSTLEKVVEGQTLLIANIFSPYKPNLRLHVYLGRCLCDDHAKLDSVLRDGCGTSHLML